MNTLEKEFAPYQESLELKELGFDEPCIMQWTYAPELIFCTSAWGRPKLKTNKESYSDSGGDCISAPTFSQAFRWFREKYGYSHSITQHEIIEGQTDLLYIDESEEFQDIGWLARVEPDFIKIFKTYEEAELACLRKLIEIVKNKN